MSTAPRRSFRRVADDNYVPTEAGTYRRVLEYWAAHCERKGIANTYWAEVACPSCGRIALLGSNHVVADDGTVSPSDVCPFPPCAFHEMIRLDDWARPATTRRS